MKDLQGIRVAAEEQYQLIQDISLASDTPLELNPDSGLTGAINKNDDNLKPELGSENVNVLPAEPVIRPQSQLGLLPQFQGVQYERLLAQTGQASVYRAAFRGVTVAVKLFHESTIKTKERRSPYHDELFNLLRLQNHPHVVRVVACFETPCPCIITEFMPGGDLRHHLTRYGVLSVYEVVRMAKAIAHGLAILHDMGVIHRDLKCANILLRSSDDGLLEPVLADFGLSHFSDNTRTDPSGLSGTLRWMAPERMREEQYSTKADIYSLGMVLLELLTAKVPFAGLSEWAVMYNVTAGKRPAISPRWDKRLVAIMERCWAHEPEQRPSATQVLTELQSWRYSQLEDLSDQLLALIFERVEDQPSRSCMRFVCRRWRAMLHKEQIYSQVHLIHRLARLGLGRLNVIKWARAQGCPWGPKTCRKAARGGHLALLQWLHANGCAWNESTCSGAAKGGYFLILQWARANGCPWNKWTCAGAAEGGHLEILQWARANGCTWNKRTCEGAAKGGHLEILQWARANGCPWDEETCAGAAEGGHLDVLQWAHANGCKWNESTCSGAAKGGYLAILQWARANGCPWDEQTSLNACLGAHLDVLEWTHANGCPWTEVGCLLTTSEAVVEWARAKGLPDGDIEYP